MATKTEKSVEEFTIYVENLNKFMDIYFKQFPNMSDDDKEDVKRKYLDNWLDENFIENRDSYSRPLSFAEQCIAGDK